MSQDYRPINRALGKTASFGPIPTALLIPFLISALTAYLGYVLGFTLLQSSFAGGFLLATWWLVSGGNSFRYLSRYSRWFTPRWQRSAQNYRPWLQQQSPDRRR